MENNNGYMVMTGNEACIRGAIAAGMRFFAGYPITPATEIAEMASELLPRVGGRYMQMEDELGSLAAVIGASFVGVKAMTASSGPGISLMQENLGVGIIEEIPCVIVDVMRQGPCQGVATVPAQGDLMQSRWGTHGDHPAIVLVPCSVAEVYAETVRAFNLSERFRTPVMLLSDATLAHLSERVRIPEHIELYERKTAPSDKRRFLPYKWNEPDEIAPMPHFGGDTRWSVTGIVHDESGFSSTGSPARIAELVKHLHNKIEHFLPEVEKYEEYRTEDAEVLIVSVGLVSRCARAAVDELRSRGVRAGLFRPITLWPFPEKRLSELLRKVKCACSCEMNEGQLVSIIKQSAGREQRVFAVTQNDGTVMKIDAIVSGVLEGCRDE